MTKDELKQRNAELKESVDFWECRYWILNDVYVKVTEEKDKQLTKAKELLRKLYDQVCGKRGDDWELIEQTEQFLKEVDK